MKEEGEGHSVLGRARGVPVLRHGTGGIGEKKKSKGGGEKKHKKQPGENMGSIITYPFLKKDPTRYFEGKKKGQRGEEKKRGEVA